MIKPLKARTFYTKCLTQMFLMHQCINTLQSDPSPHDVTLCVRLVLCHPPLTCQIQLNQCNTKTHHGFHPQHLRTAFDLWLPHSLRSLNATQRATFYRQSKVRIDGLLVTHYYKKDGRRCKALAYSTQCKFGGISHMLIKRAQMPFSTPSPFVRHYSV